MLWKRMYTLFLQKCQLENSRPSTCQENFHEANERVMAMEEDRELGKICAPSTVNNTESESFLSPRWVCSELFAPEKAASHFY